jgi:SPOR domain
MNARNNSVRSIDLEEFERELREIASASVARKASDPLAELARIVGREVVPRGKPASSTDDSELASHGSEPRRPQDRETPPRTDLGDVPTEAQAEVIPLRAEPDPAPVQAPKPQQLHAGAYEAIGDAWASPREESYAPQYPQYEDDIGHIVADEDPVRGGRARRTNNPTWRTLAQRHPLAVLSALALIAVGLGSAILAQFSQVTRIDAPAPAAIVDENPVKNTPTAIVDDDPTPATSSPLPVKAADTPVAPVGQDGNITAAPTGRPTADAGAQPSASPMPSMQPVPNPAVPPSPPPATAAPGAPVQSAPGLVAGSMRPPPSGATISPALAGPLSTQGAPPAPGRTPAEVVGSTAPTSAPAARSVVPNGKGRIGEKGQTPATSSPPKSAAVKDAGIGSYSVKLGSSTTEKDAQMTMTRLQKEFPGVLPHAYVKREDMGAEGVFYRVRVGPLSRDAADKLCSQLKAAGRSCASSGHNGA